MPTKLLPCKFSLLILWPLQTTKNHVQMPVSGMPPVHFQPVVNLDFDVSAAAKSHMKDTSPVVVGEKVGNAVVGCSVGCGDGFEVGAIVGIEVGKALGSTVGWPAGCPEG